MSNSYLKDINNYYSFTKIIKYSIVISILIITVDILNIPTNYYISHNSLVNNVILGGVISLLVLMSFELNSWDTLKIVSTNVVDAVLFTTLFSIVNYSITIYFLNYLTLYKIIIVGSTLGLTLVTIAIRIFRYNRAIVYSRNFQSNGIDLKDIYEGNFRIHPNESVFVNERDVDYDLLKRQNIINQLYDAIIKSNPDGRFVISLEGKWGSGKTTIINNVKKKIFENNNDVIIVDEFDPLAFADQEMMLYNMFDIILQKSGFKYSNVSIKQMYDSLTENFFGKRNTSILRNLFTSNIQMGVLKSKINNHLKLCGKKVVFFIDNIDRIENENVILLFKLVGTVFDFERVTYILSFDDERVKIIFENQLCLDYQYLKKVIQMPIRVPKIDKNVVSDLFERCLNNILLAYGEKIEDLNYYKSIVHCISKQTEDLRDFKRVINSVISIPFHQGKYLNKIDLLTIEYLRIINPSLYEQIYKNKEFFVSHDKIVDNNLFSKSFDSKKFNEQAKEFYDELFKSEDNKMFLEVLKVNFPYVEKFLKKQQFEYDSQYFSTEEYSDIAKTRRICSAKYFDLYFTNTENDYLLVGKLVEYFIKDLNELNQFDDIKTLYNNFVESVPLYYHKELFERIQLYLDDINANIIVFLVDVIFSGINKIDDSPTFLSLEARKRVELIIWELLIRITEVQFDTFLVSIKSEYSKIEIISSLMYWFENDNKSTSSEIRKEKLRTFYQEMGERILNLQINLYDDKYYSPKNIWGLFRLYRDDIPSFKKYIKAILDERSIFRLLFDITRLSHGTKYKYYISSKYLNDFTSEMEVDALLKKTSSMTEDQNIVLDIYNFYKLGKAEKPDILDSPDNWNEQGLIVEKSLNLKL